MEQTWIKFGKDRHKPIGDWVQTTLVEKVVGIIYRKQNAVSFADAVKTAERNSLLYGVQLELEPQNPEDSNAIKVYGFAEYKSFLGSIKRTAWHIGYLAAETAAELNTDLVSRGVPISAELYSIFENHDYIDISVIILAPPGFSLGMREKNSDALNGSPEQPTAKVQRLKDQGNFDEAINLLLDICDQQESESMRTQTGVAPWCYEELAKIFKKMKFREEELAILERYDRQIKAPGVTPLRLKSRLESARSRS